MTTGPARRRHRAAGRPRWHGAAGRPRWHGAAGRPQRHRAPGRPRPHGPSTGAGGQAAVEVALVVPLLALLALALLQVALVVRDQVLVVHAAREGARQAAVDPAPDAARRAALAGAPLAPGRTDVEATGRAGRGSRVTVRVRYRSPTDVPLVGGLVSDVVLSSQATMRVERGPTGASGASRAR